MQTRVFDTELAVIQGGGFPIGLGVCPVRALGKWK